ncbi:MAG: AI-2E family transporter [Tissierellia bacterium]|nr:AI-2E family transporter [Tissierellia bacterium]
MGDLMIFKNSDFFEVLKTFFLITLTALVGLSAYYLINVGNKHVDENKRIIIYSSKVKKLIIVLIPIILAMVLISKFSILKAVTGALIFSLALSIILNPMVNWFRSKGLKPAQAVIILYVIMLLVLIFLVLMVMPTFVGEFKIFVMSFDDYLVKLSNILEEFAINYRLDRFGLDAKNIDLDFSKFFADESILNNAGKWFDSVMKGFSGVTSKFFSLFLILVFTFFILSEKDMLIEKFIDVMPKQFKEDIDEYTELSHQINQTVVDFMKGRILMALFVGVATAIFLTIMDIDFAIIIGIVTFVADIIPYIGPFLGFLPAVFFAFIASPLKALIVAIVFMLIQWVENNIIGPKVLSDGVGLHPIVVLMCIIIGGGMFGVIGMIFAVPAVAIAYTVIKFFIEKRKL